MSLRGPGGFASHYVVRPWQRQRSVALNFHIRRINQAML